MQMCWNDSFSNRLVFNAAKAYVRQLDIGENYDLLQPVYGLGITNDIFDYKTQEFYHHYQTINRKNTDEVIQGLEFVLVELPKFKPERWVDRKMAVLWLRFLKEIKGQTSTVSEDLLSDKNISKALNLCEVGAFKPEELAAYEKYWDIVSTEKAMLSTSYAKGEAFGVEKGRAEGLAEGIAKGRAEELKNMVISGARNGFTIAQIQAITNLPEEKIEEILIANKI
jgi:predicted transposase/invertase (TIGR01784 family)